MDRAVFLHMLKDLRVPQLYVFKHVIHMHACMYVYDIWIELYSCTCSNTLESHNCVYSSMLMICMCVCICMYVCMYVNIYIYIYIYL